jgi:hypothetical protein
VTIAVAVDVRDFAPDGPAAPVTVTASRLQVDAAGATLVSTAPQTIASPGSLVLEPDTVYRLRFTGISALTAGLWVRTPHADTSLTALYLTGRIDPITEEPLPAYPSIGAAIAALGERVDAILAGASPAFDTLLELQTHLTGDDTALAGLLSTLGTKLDQAAVDARIAAIVPNAAGLESSAHAAATYAPRLRYWPLGTTALARVRTELAEGARSTGILIDGDSTTYTAATTRFPAVVANTLAAQYPGYAVQLINWNTTSLDFDPPTVVSGTPTARRANLTGVTALQHYGDGTTITGDLDLRAKVSFPTWAPGPGGNYALLTHQGGVGSANGFIFEVRSNGNLSLQWGTSATVLSTLYQSTVAAPFTAGTPLWARATLAVATGVVTFYTSTDGTTWTQLGATTGPAAATTLNDPGIAVPFEFGAWNVTNDYFIGSVYEVEVRNGIGGPRIVPRYLDRWAPRYGAAPTIVTYSGAPVLTVVAAGAPGQNLAYLNTNVQKMTTTSWCSDAVFLNIGHNDASLIGRAYWTALDTWLTAVRGKGHQGVGVFKQNPEAATVNDEHPARPPAG